MAILKLRRGITAMFSLIAVALMRLEDFYALCLNDAATAVFMAILKLSTRSWLYTQLEFPFVVNRHDYRELGEIIYREFHLKWCIDIWHPSELNLKLWIF